MTRTDYLVHQQRDAANAILKRLNELGELILISRQAVTIGLPPSTDAMRVKIIAVAEAHTIYLACTHALHEYMKEARC